MSRSRLRWSLAGVALPVATLAPRAEAQPDRAFVAIPPPPPDDDADLASSPDEGPTLEVATSPELPYAPPRRPRHRVSHGCGAPDGHRTLVGVKVSGGQTSSGASQGLYQRVEIEALGSRMKVATSTFSVAPLGLETWQIKGSGGVSLPFSLAFGLGTPNLYLNAGGGVEVLAYDGVQSKGVAIFAPFATAQTGVWVGKLRISAEIRAVRRWFFATDANVYRDLGLSVGYYIR